MFPGTTADDLWWRHQEAEQAVERFEGVALADSDADCDFASFFPAEVRNGALFVLKRPLLWLTLPWRYFVTRHRLRTVTVAEQFQRGWHKPKLGGFATTKSPPSRA